MIPTVMPILIFLFFYAIRAAGFSSAKGTNPILKSLFWHNSCNSIGLNPAL